MSRYITGLGAFLAVAMVIVPHMASGADRFTAPDWTADTSTDVLDGAFAGRLSANTYSFASPDGGHPSIMLAGGLDDDPFLLDGRFRNGQIYTDRFGANNGDSTDKYAHKVVRLSNGDVVMVGLVPKLGATANPAYGIGYNIGLVRYNAEGVKQKWAHAWPEYTDSTKSYYVVPNKDVFSSTGSYSSIDDVKEHNGRIYVLARRYHSETNHTTDVIVLSFDVDSSPWDFYPVFWSSQYSEWGVGMHFYNSGGLNRLTVVVGRTVSRGKYETWMERIVVDGNGSFNVDTSFGDNGILNVSPPSCDRCKPVAMDGSFIHPGVTYIAGNNMTDSINQDGYLIKLDKNGAMDTSFSNAGFRYIWFSGPVNIMKATDAVNDIVVGTNMSGSADDIYVLATVENKCNTSSAGVAKFTYLGEPDMTFGAANGQLLFGGGGSDPPDCVAFTSTTPRAMAVNKNRLAIVGYSTLNFLGHWGGPSFSVVDKDIGYVSSHFMFEPTGVDIGPNGGDGASYFNSVVANVDSFYVGGRAKDVANNHRNVPMTARVRADRIFGNGME